MLSKRKKNKNTGSSIAKKIVADLTGLTRRKVVDLGEIRNAKIIAKDLDKTILSKEDMSRLDPVHAVYAYGQNKMSVLVEQLAPLPAVAKLSAACADADQEYMPSGPPMSPLTQSYFFAGPFSICVPGAGRSRSARSSSRSAKPSMLTKVFCRSSGICRHLAWVFICTRARSAGLCNCGN